MFKTVLNEFESGVNWAGLFKEGGYERRKQSGECAIGEKVAVAEH